MTMNHFTHVTRLCCFACWLLVTIGTARILADEPQSTSQTKPAEIRIGIDEGDIRGADHRALQAAVDYVAGIGGGTVRIGPGRYQMRNALKLRDNIHVIGVEGKTILVACDGFASPLAADGDANERQITVEDPSGFRVGDGVSIEDRDSGGFEVTTATRCSADRSQLVSIVCPLVPRLHGV